MVHFTGNVQPGTASYLLEEVVADNTQVETQTGKFRHTL